MSMVRRLLAVWLALAVAAPAVARAQPAEDPRPREAKAACAAGEIQKGIRLLADLYADTEDLNWVYNQARCYQQNGWADEAIERFQEYLRRARDITPAERQEVDGFIAELEQRRQRRAGDAPLPGLTPPPPAAGPGSEAQLTAAPPRAEHPGRRLSIAGVTLAGVGAAALVSGLWFGSRVRSLEREAEDWNTTGQVTAAQYQDNQRSAHRNEVGQWISYSAAALALAGSGTCLYLRLRRRPEASRWSLALSPSLLPGGGGGQLRLRF
jgi:hypothetical protein